MNEEQRALLIPSKVLFELWAATVFHLFERGAIDPSMIAQSLEARQESHERDGNEEVAQLLKFYMHWLATLERGKFSPPTSLH